MTMADKELEYLIARAISEDVGSGDHTSLACINRASEGKAKLLVKEKGIIAGLRAADEVFRQTDPNIIVRFMISDGSRVKPGDIAFTVTGSQQSLLRAERLVLNIMQRMSGIATVTALYVDAVKGTGAKIIDTRKTTPGIRFLEKEAVRLGAGFNHRMGLYDMIMIKDNHIDFTGGIEEAIKQTREYLKRTALDLKIVIEARSLNDVSVILATGGADRIMFDNFTTEETRKAVEMVNGKTETESSGGITINTVRDYALCGVDFISVGALTHHIKSLDMSLKAF
ncbi:MAG: carboxylating nicotinate-nucleotide diphosphorylase [Bacteroidales bacterium]